VHGEIALFPADGAKTKKVPVRPATYQTELKSPVGDAQSMDGAKFKHLIANDPDMGEEMNASNVSSSQLIHEKSPGYVKPGSSVSNNDTRKERSCRSRTGQRVQELRRKKRKERQLRI